MTQHPMNPASVYRPVGFHEAYQWERDGVGYFMDPRHPICTACISSIDWETCATCGGEGYFEEPLWEYGEPASQAVGCQTCEREGGWWACLGHRCGRTWDAGKLPEPEQTISGRQMIAAKRELEARPRPWWEMPSGPHIVCDSQGYPVGFFGTSTIRVKFPPGVLKP